MDNFIQKLKTFFENERRRYAAVIAGVIIIALVIYFFDLFPDLVKKLEFGQKGKVIEDNLTIPDTQKISGIEGRFVLPGIAEVKLHPKSEAETVIVSRAVLTVKGAYDKSLSEALNWQSDAKLSFIKSLGSVTLEGKSSQWQIIFVSKAAKGNGYEIIIQGSEIVSKKQIEAMVIVGGEAPKNFSERDSNWAIGQMAPIPQFSEASISAINFSYNSDAKGWDYIIANSFGNGAIRVR